MGLEQRGNSLYYYRKERLGERVVSVYAGCGLDAASLAKLDAKVRADRAWERARRSVVEDADHAIDELGKVAQTVARAVLLASECYTHKGEWRRCRRKPKSAARV